MGALRYSLVILSASLLETLLRSPSCLVLHAVQKAKGTRLVLLMRVVARLVSVALQMSSAQRRARTLAYRTVEHPRFRAVHRERCEIWLTTRDGVPAETAE
jgi:hypothetical protein